MKSKSVRVPCVTDPIKRSPGFAKKLLSDYKLDILALCGFGCRYCSSNAGNYLRINRQKFADLTEDQLGDRLLPADDPALTFVWPDVLDNLERQLAKKRRSWGNGETMVFSMLTDGFSPDLVRTGVTRKALEMLLERTSFRIRVLTKNAVVGNKAWTKFFSDYRSRFIVGLSTGSLDGRWARGVEIGTSSPQARLRALKQLQAAGVPTYAMLCPMFPDLLREDGLERLVDAVGPGTVEHVWAEPYNDRVNWQVVRDGYDPADSTFDWFTDVYAKGNKERWSTYATALYTRLRRKAQAEGWLSKLRYLLYENHIVASDAGAFSGLHGVLLQSAPNENGRSRNRHIAAMQQAIC